MTTSDTRHSSSRTRPRRGRPRTFLQASAAVELLALVDDTPGNADEDLLDEVLAALDHPLRTTVVQQGWVAVSFSNAERDAIRQLISSDTENPDALASARAKLSRVLTPTIDEGTAAVS